MPALEPERVAVRSQLHRAVRIAGELELLDGEGALQLDAFRQIDSASKPRFRNFYEAADYVADRDTVAFGRFGVPMREIRNAVPAEYSNYVLYGWNSAADTVEVVETHWSAETQRGFRVDGIGGYSALYTEWRSWNSGQYPYYELTDSTLNLHLPGCIPMSPFRRRSFSAICCGRRASLRGACRTKRRFGRKNDELLVYRSKELAVVFSEVWFERSDSALRVDKVSVDVVLTR